MINENKYIEIKKPSAKLLSMIERMREHKRAIREEMRNVEPLFTLRAK